MSARPLTLVSVKPCTAAMLTVLNDGQWHPRSEVRQRGHLTCLAEERDATLSWAARILARRAQDGIRTEQDQLDLGAKGVTYNRLDILARRGRVEVDGDQVRMTATALAQWREATGYIPTDALPAPAQPDAAATPAGIPQTSTPGTAWFTLPRRPFGDAPESRLFSVVCPRQTVGPKRPCGRSTLSTSASTIPCRLQTCVPT